ncbi:MAG TPA: ATP-dependent sacrificial sulfur transferase LarE [Syntrophomonadaceae bacterium]|nr:ATP-dependent sacrificial sulfur transferase LarE [Syntrophomonadaceae bacterium]
MPIEQKLAQLEKKIASLGTLAVAFSGGVDSTFLLAVAVKVLGDRVMAVTALSSSYTDREARQSVELANLLMARHMSLPLEQLEIPGFADNPKDRCYLCKKQLFKKIIDLAGQNGIKFVADGSNADDLVDYRPGLKALKELGVISPLIEAGLRKNEIRALSRQMDLPTWDKPAAACLFSRFAYGENLTREKLDRVDTAEQYLLNLGFKQVRVRMHGELARIEVSPDERHKLLEGNRMDEVSLCLKNLGFQYVTLDLQGYRTGSMNEALE